MQSIDLGEMEVDFARVDPAAGAVGEACGDRSGDGWALADVVPLSMKGDGSLLLVFSRPRRVDDATSPELPERDRLKPGTACEVCGHLTNGRAELCYFHLAEWYAEKGRGKYRDAADMLLFSHGKAMAAMWGESPSQKQERTSMEETARTFYDQRQYWRTYEVLHNFFGEHRFGTVLPNVRELSDEELHAECERLINAEEAFEQYLPRTLNALQELSSRNRVKLGAMAAHIARSLNLEEVERACRTLYLADTFPGPRMSHGAVVGATGNLPDFFFYAQHEHAGGEPQGWSLRANFIGGTASFGVFAPGDLEAATAKFREALAARLDALSKEDDSDG